MPAPVLAFDLFAHPRSCNPSARPQVSLQQQLELATAKVKEILGLN